MSVTETVKRLLRENLKTRSSDKELIIAFLETQGLFLSSDQKVKFRQAPPLETLRRLRQQIQAAGFYRADIAVKKARTYKSLRMQQIAPTAKPRYVEQVLEDNEQLRLI